MGKKEDEEKLKNAQPEEVKPDWSRNCDICGETPVVPLTGMCGPCTWGDADTYGGNW